MKFLPSLVQKSTNLLPVNGLKEPFFKITQTHHRLEESIPKIIFRPPFEGSISSLQLQHYKAISPGVIAGVDLGVFVVSEPVANQEHDDRRPLVT